MLTLTGQREIAKCNLYKDDTDPLIWYMMPQGPRIALDDSTRTPVFSMVEYRRDVSMLTDEERKTRLGGGILTLSTELSATDDQLHEIRKTIAADPELQGRLADSNPKTGPHYASWWNNEINRSADKLADALKISTVPITDGTVTLAILAESPDAGHPGEFVSTLIGVGRVSMTGRERASFMAKLTLDGAELMVAMIGRNLPSIRVAYDLTFNHRLDAVTMIAHCDARKAYNATHEQWHNISDDASWSETHSGNNSSYSFGADESDTAGGRILQTAISSEAAWVKIISEANDTVVKPELVEQLQKTGYELIKDFLAATFLEAKPGSDVKQDEEPTLKTDLPEVGGRKYGHDAAKYYDLKTWDESMKAEMNFQFSTQAVLQGHLAPNDNLSNILQGHRVDDLVTHVDLDQSLIFKYIDVTVMCTADFDADPVDLVKAHLSYQGRGAGGNINQIKDFVFGKGTGPQRFSTYLAGLDQKAYDYEIEIFYKGSSLSYKERGRTDETILVLDTDRLGVLRVDVQMGLIDWARIKQVLVKMSYGAGADRKEAQFALDAQHQSARWTEVIAAAVTSPYTYQVTYVDANGQHIELPPDTSRSNQLVLNQPLEEDLVVAIVPAGSFGATGLLQRVTVAVRYKDPAHNYIVSDVFQLASETDSKSWRVPLVDKNIRTYEYQVTVIYRDGVTRNDNWRTTDQTVLAAGDPFGWRVSIVPNLLAQPAGLYAFGVLHLSFDDQAPEGPIHAEEDIHLADFKTEQVWRFRTATPDRHTYSYQLTLFKADGSKLVVPPIQTSTGVLVLQAQPTT
jgi:hypothetical protein